MTGNGPGENGAHCYAAKRIPERKNEKRRAQGGGSRARHPPRARFCGLGILWLLRPRARGHFPAISAAALAYTFGVVKAAGARFELKPSYY